MFLSDKDVIASFKTEFDFEMSNKAIRGSRDS